jgi:hypothetical protein
MRQSRQATSAWSEAHQTASDDLSLTTLRHDTATAPGFPGSQAETGGNGQESTSRAVQRRVVLLAAIAGVHCR